MNLNPHSAHRLRCRYRPMHVTTLGSHVVDVDVAGFPDVHTPRATGGSWGSGFGYIAALRHGPEDTGEGPRRTCVLFGQYLLALPGLESIGCHTSSFSDGQWRIPAAVLE